MLALPRRRAATLIAWTPIRFCVSVAGLVARRMYVHRPERLDGRKIPGERVAPAIERRAPRASDTVTTAGSASGIAATARLSAVRNIRNAGSPRSRPTPKITVQSARIDDRELRRETLEAPLKRREGVLDLLDQIRHAAELGAHAGGDDDPLTAAVSDHASP